MKSKILYRWDLRRALYFIGGVTVVVYAIVVREWWGVPAGAYFAAMGLFNLGCASGSCGYGPRRERTSNPREQSFEGIKNK